MERLTLRLSSSEKEMIDAYCEKKEMTVNAALRELIIMGLEKAQQSEEKISLEHARYELLVNEQRGHRASVESLLLLRYLVSDKETLENVKKKAESILENGWKKEEPEA